MPFWTTAAILGGTALAGSAISAHAAGKAAGKQVSAANYAAQLQHEDAQKALEFQQKQWDTQQKNLAPWLGAGTDAIGQISGLMKNGGFPAFSEKFAAPTDVTEKNDPGYQFRLQQGLKAYQNSAAAKGNLFSGNTLEGLNNYAQNYASNEYSNIYNRSMGEFQNRYNIFENNQTNQFNRLAALSGIGQQSATTLGQQGQAAANNTSNILLTSGQQEGNAIQNAAAARASGYVGAANAWNSGLSGATNNLGILAMLARMNGGGPSASSIAAQAGIDQGIYPQ